MPPCRRPDVVGECGETLCPGKLRGGRWEFGEEEFNNAIEQVGFVDHVTVERHGRDAEALGETCHGDRVKSLLVGHRQGLG